MKHAIIGTAVAAALVSCTAEFSDTEPPAMRAKYEAPLRFQGDYAGKLTVIEVPVEDVNKECAHRWFSSTGLRARAERDVMLGCAIPLVGECIVVVMDEAMRYENANGWFYTTKEDVLAHEIAHCNGWSAEHEH